MKPTKLFIVFFNLLLGCMILTSCTSSGLQPEKITPDSTSTAQILPSATAKPATSTLSLPTPTETSTLQPSETPIVYVTTQTLLWIKELPEGAQIIGYPVLGSSWIDDSPDELEYFQIHILDINNGEERTIAPEDSSAGFPRISPDGNWLSYFQTPGLPKVRITDEDKAAELRKNFILIVEDKHGVEIYRTKVEEGWTLLNFWLNNDAIAIRRAPVDDWYSTYTAFLTINPFTGEQINLPPEPDDLWQLYPDAYQDRYGSIVYSPDLTRRVYLNMSEDIVLEDLVSNQIIGTYNVPVGVPARWSPDGKQFVTVLFNENDSREHELYLVSRDGEVSQLTQISQLYPNASLVQNYAWSPDGSKIAFLISTTKLYDPVYLGIVDVSTGYITIYNNLPIISHEFDPIWSPDGRQILVNIRERQQPKTMLVDLDGGWVLYIGENTTPVGWLSSEE